MVVWVEVLSGFMQLYSVLGGHLFQLIKNNLTRGMLSFWLLRVGSFANLLTGNKSGCKIFRDLTGHALEGHNSLAIVQLVLNRQPRQAF